jgi:hypothetical protein
MALFDKAFNEFVSRERANIRKGVNERNLCSRFAMYLQHAAEALGLEGYYSDAEYNRNNGQIKTILDDQMKVVSINCDVILHSRGEIIARDNLIAIEIKKSERPEQEKESDRRRLKALTKQSYDGIWSADGVTLPEHVCGYELGYFIDLDIQNTSVKVEVFKNGKPIDTFTRHF